MIKLRDRVHRIGRKCLNYDTCGPWRVFTVKPNDEEWDRSVRIVILVGVCSLVNTTLISLQIDCDIERRGS